MGSIPLGQGLQILPPRPLQGNNIDLHSREFSLGDCDYADVSWYNHGVSTVGNSVNTMPSPVLS